MTALATAADVATVLQRTLSTEETAAATELLDLVTGEIEEAIGFSFTGTNHDVSLSGSWDQWLELPTDVASVTSVSIDGTALDVAGWFWRAGRSLRRGPNPAEEWQLGADDVGTVRQGAMPSAGVFHWGGPASTVRVVYTSPAASVPAWLKSFAIRVVIGALTNPEQVESESLGAYSVRYSAKGGDAIGLLTEAQHAMLGRRYQRVTTTIVPTVR